MFFFNCYLSLCWVVVVILYMYRSIKKLKSKKIDVQRNYFHALFIYFIVLSPSLAKVLFFEHKFISSYYSFGVFTVWLLIIVSVGITFMGLRLLILGHISLAEQWNPNINLDANKLEMGGAYKLCRNPIYSAQNLLTVGTTLGIVMQNIYPFYGLLLIACMVSVLLSNHYRIVKEEEFLESQFGNEFIEFRRRVPRYFSEKFITTKES